jgi:hypothetical protein
MSIVLVGSTSGSCTLQEQAVAGTTVLTLPATSGTIITTGSSGQSIPKAALPTGSVLQVVYGSTSTAVSSSTNTYVDTNLTASITPTSSSSKILVLVNQNGTNKDTTSPYMAIRIVRGSTTVLTYAITDGYSDGSVHRWGSSSASYLDSPATTSATTYKTQFCSLGNTAYVEVQNNNAVSTIILMEIAA